MDNSRSTYSKHNRAWMITLVMWFSILPKNVVQSETIYTPTLSACLLWASYLILAIAITLIEQESVRRVGWVLS